MFAIEVCAYAVMSNHYHVVLHINTQEAKQWNRNEILNRWTALFSGSVLVQRYLSGSPMHSATLAKLDEHVVEEYRSRLMDISWFMRCLNEYLAREANKEDGCKGRYKSQALLDEAALLTCMAYVDLNPIRAKLAKIPETSDYTSIKERIEKVNGNSARKQVAHLKPLRLQGQNPDTAIPFALSSYLELVDWSGRIVRRNKRGYIPADIPPILVRLHIDPDEWLKTMRWSNRFRRAVGKLATLKAYAEQTGRRWVHGMDSSRCLFST